MSPAEADRRILLSRQSLNRYAAMTRAGTWPVGDLTLMTVELSVLERIADAHPDKAQKAYNLGESWLAMIEAVRGKLH